MKRSLQIVSLITFMASAMAAHADEQARPTGKSSESVKQQQTRKPLIFRKYWAAKSWDSNAGDFWHSASREVISVETAANTEAALLVKKQQEARGEH